MTKTPRALLMLLSLVATAASANPYETVLQNGLKVVVKEDRRGGAGGGLGTGRSDGAGDGLGDVVDFFLQETKHGESWSMQGPDAGTAGFGAIRARIGAPRPTKVKFYQKLSSDLSGKSRSRWNPCARLVP